MKIGDYYVGIASKCAIAGLSVLTLSAAFSPAAIAVDAEEFPLVQGVRFGQIPYEFEQRFFTSSQNFYESRSFTGQLRNLFGPFPENSISRDAARVNNLYVRTQYQQMNSGPIVRTVDLPTPFQYSLRTLPPPVVVAPIPYQPEPTVIAPTAPAPVAPAKPIPALW